MRPKRLARVELCELAWPDRLNLAGVTGLSEGGHPGDAHLLHRVAGRLEVVARVELLRALRQYLADRPGHGHPVVRVDVDLPDPVLDPPLNLLDRDAPGLLHLPAVLVDDVLQLLR